MNAPSNQLRSVDLASNSANRGNIAVSFGIEFLILFVGVLLAQLVVTSIDSMILRKWAMGFTTSAEIVLIAVIAGPLVMGIRRTVFSYLADRDGGAPEKENDLREVIQLRERLEQSAPGGAESLLVMVEIDGRVRRLQKRTNAILLAIGFSLIAAALIVIFAGRLTSLDASAVSNIDRLNTEMVAARRRLNTLHQVQRLYTALDEARRKNSSGEIEKLESEISRVPRGEERLTEAKAITAFITDEEKRLEKFGELLEDGWKRELSSERGYNDWKYIIATAITRIGVVVILVYLVQILMGLYRYNTRMVAYYNSRRDILTIWNGNQGSLKLLDSVLSAPKVDFGKEPKHPLEDMIKALGTRIKEAASKKTKGGEDKNS